MTTRFVAQDRLKPLLAALLEFQELYNDNAPLAKTHPSLVESYLW